MKDIKGMTLVEIVVSLAVFGIMIVVFLNVFLGSFIITMRADVRDTAVADVSGEIEKKIADPVSLGTAGTATITYHGGVVDAAPGKTVTHSVTTENGEIVTINYFIPEETE